MDAKGLQDEQDELQTPLMKKAYLEGYKAAQTKYAVTYNCPGCGKNITIDTQDERRAVAQYMKEHGWGHSGCVKK